jgi:hypothetical protein
MIGSKHVAILLQKANHFVFAIKHFCPHFLPH